MAKIELQDFVKYGQLFQFYGNLLSDDRQKIMSDYFEFNMTLAEIGRDKNISRQAVLDAIEKSCQKLDEFEEKLNLLARKNQFVEQLNTLKSQACELQKKVDDILRKI